MTQTELPSATRAGANDAIAAPIHAIADHAGPGVQFDEWRSEPRPEITPDRCCNWAKNDEISGFLVPRPAKLLHACANMASAGDGQRLGRALTGAPSRRHVAMGESM